MRMITLVHHVLIFSLSRLIYFACNHLLIIDVSFKIFVLQKSFDSFLVYSEVSNYGKKKRVYGGFGFGDQDLCSKVC